MLWVGPMILFFPIILLWSIFWKAWALWTAARKGSKIWFGALLIINTFGLLEIAYIYYFSRQNRLSRPSFTVEEANEVATRLGVKWDKYNVDQFRKGMDVELEHGKVNSVTNVTNDDLDQTAKIALAHLNEIPDYYDRLDKMEEEGEKYWEEKKTV